MTLPRDLGSLLWFRRRLRHPGSFSFRFTVNSRKIWCFCFVVCFFLVLFLFCGGFVLVVGCFVFWQVHFHQAGVWSLEPVTLQRGFRLIYCSWRVFGDGWKNDKSEGRFQVKINETHHSPTTFASWGVEQRHGYVARNEQNVQGAPARDQGGCEEMARRCGATRMHLQHTLASDHFSKFGWKNCTLLWCETRVQFQNRKKRWNDFGQFFVS